MKFYYVLLLFMVASMSARAQTPTGDIQKDTALANQYFEKAIQLAEKKNQGEACIKLLNKVITLYEAHPSSIQLIEVRGFYALQLTRQGQLQKAIATAEETIDLATKKEKTEDEAMVYTYTALGEAYLSIDNAKTVRYSEKALELASKYTDLRYEIAIPLFLTYPQTRQVKKMETLIQSLEKTLTQSSEQYLKRNELYTYFGKMAFFRNADNMGQALFYGDKIVLENERYQLLSDEMLNNLYGMLAQMYSSTQKFDKAFEAVDKLKELNKTSKDKAAYGAIHAILAWIYIDQRKIRKAVKFYKKAIGSFSKDEQNQQVALHRTYSDLAYTYMRVGFFDAALESNLKCSKYGYHPVQDYVLGKIYNGKKEYKKSVEAFHKAMIEYCTQFKNKDIAQNPSEYEEFTESDFAAQVILNKGINQIKWGKVEKDAATVKAGIETIELSKKITEVSWLYARGFDESLFFKNEVLENTIAWQIDGYRILLEQAPSDEVYNELFTAFQQKKAIDLMNTLTPSLLPEEVMRKEQNLYQEMQLVSQQLDLAENNKNIDSIKWYQDKLLSVNTEMEQHLAEIKVEYPKQFNNFYHADYGSIEAIQAALPENTLLISYISAIDGVTRYPVVMTISKDTRKVIRIGAINFKNIKKLNELIQDRFSFQKPIREEFIDVSHQLYKELIAPIEAELEGKTRLMFTSEGPLFYLPFEVLLASNEKKSYQELDFLIKKYEINYNYSAATFLQIQKKSTTKDKSLFAFAPVFNEKKSINEKDRSIDFVTSSLYRSFDKGTFAALPNTKKETDAIAKIIKANGGTASMLLQKEATKTNFNQQIDQQSYQFVHIATHSLVNFKQPKLSAFACYAADETMESLAYANEIQFKDINADLVILSSCESGIGRSVAGEGLIALNRSFIYAGAKNVMFSLWKVSDKYSSELMIDFYKYYFENAENASYTSALRQAKLKMISNPASAVPKYWSAFVLMGQ